MLKINKKQEANSLFSSRIQRRYVAVTVVLCHTGERWINGHIKHVVWPTFWWYFWIKNGHYENSILGCLLSGPCVILTTALRGVYRDKATETVSCECLLSVSERAVVQLGNAWLLCYNQGFHVKPEFQHTFFKLKALKKEKCFSAFILFIFKFNCTYKTNF